MKVTITLSDETGLALKAQAEARGLTPEQVLVPNNNAFPWTHADDASREYGMQIDAES